MRAEARGGAAWELTLIGPALLLLSAGLYWGPDLLDIPEGDDRAVHASRIATEPRREHMGDRPVIHINAFDFACMECHRLFPPSEIPPEELRQHDHIVLDHGINDRCRNCHDVEDRDRLVLRGGETIPYGEVALLCAKCHGPTFRDWEAGVHGRSNGYWDTDRGERQRLACTQCHDPHDPRVPAMDPLRPLPGPGTLRMDGPAHGEATEGARDPLREAIERGRRAGGGAALDPGGGH